jgi:GGDEF domain-containing protein
MSVTPLNADAHRGAVVSLEDITQRVEMEQQVRELAFFDPLTHLPNRRLALERLTQQLVRARRSRSILALLFIDLDKFKPVNDELGHAMGDWLLQENSQRNRTRICCPTWCGAKHHIKHWCGAVPRAWRDRKRPYAPG